MPSYDYKCLKCGKIEEVTHRITETPHIDCSGCGSVMERQVSFNGGGFIIKGGSPSIHWREKRLRTKMNEEAGERMRKRYGNNGGPQITPNVMGVPQESWSDCQKLAKECGLNADSYQSKVDQEKKKKIQVFKP